MISNRYKIIILIIILLTTKIALADSEDIETIVEYDISEESTDSFVDEAFTDLEINTDKRYITLPRGEGGLSKIEFTNEDNYPVAYSVMTSEGIVQYVYNGVNMMQLDSLKVEADNPITFATKSSSPDTVVAVQGESGNDIIYYSYGAGTMVENPVLSINGLTEVRSMAFSDDEDILVLDGEEVHTYQDTGTDMNHVPQLTIENLENPFDIASRSGQNITVLEENKIRQFEFNGISYSEIPSMAIDIEEGIKPRLIAGSDEKISFIDDKNAYTYVMTGEGFSYVKALSVTDKLVSPQAISIHRDTNDLIILDKDGEEAKVRYFVEENGKMIERDDMSVVLEDIILGTGLGSSGYALKGELISKQIEIKKENINYLQIGAYTYLEEDTSIVFSLSPGKDSTVWTPMWRLTKEKGEKSKLYKNVDPDGEQADWDYEGDIEDIYPQNLELDGKFSGVTSVDTEFEVVEDEEGNLLLNPSNWNDGWLSMPIDMGDSGDPSYIRLKMEFSSEEGETTPYLYVPYHENEVFPTAENDDIALTIVGTEAPPRPMILGDLGWIYTTTPTIKWETPGLEDDNYQSSYQFLVMAKDGDSWKTTLATDKIEGEAGKSQQYIIPTSEEIDIEGPLYASGEYEFAAFVKIWDKDDIPTEYSLGKRFNVLAYERPRITKIISTPNEDFTKTQMIKEGMTEEDLPKAKAGTAITLTLDSVGPIEEDVESGDEISQIFYNIDEDKSYVSKGKVESERPPGSKNNRWHITFWTHASVKEVPEDTVVKAILTGNHHIGGTTEFSITNHQENHADGVVKIKNTVYEDWNVFLKGRER